MCSEPNSVNDLKFTMHRGYAPRFFGGGGYPVYVFCGRPMDEIVLRKVEVKPTSDF